MQNGYFTLNKRHKSLTDLKASFGNSDFKLDLGCGYYKVPGYMGFDNGVGFGNQQADEGHAPDVFMDLDKHRLPLDDNSCAEVRTSHFLEHSGNIDHVINEAYRVLKPDGVFVIIVPYANSAEGMYPGHQLFLTEKWFHENVNFLAKFDLVGEKFYPSTYWKRLPLVFRLVVPFRLARLFLFNACQQMELRSRPRKQKP
jgi:SAM-dependent methyltransferase